MTERLKVTIRKTVSPELAAAEKELADLNGQLAREMAKSAVDVAGVFDPTPVSDGVSMAMSIAEGDAVGAGLSLISMVPYVGDAVGKTAKGARTAKKLNDLRKRIAAATALAEKLRAPAKSVTSKVDDAVGLLKTKPAAKIEPCIPCAQAAKAARGKVPAKPKAAPKSPYRHLEDPPGVGPGKDPTPAQKRKLIEENKRRNGGVVKSDDPKDFFSKLTKAQKSKRGVTPRADEWQTDHIIPKSKGGTNSYKNLRVISRKLNRQKSNK